MRQWGWSPEWSERFEPWRQQGFVPGRIALEHQHLYTVYSEYGELLAEITGKMRYEAAGRTEYPAVGDWVALAARPEEGRASIHGILPRISKFSRKAAGSATEEQMIAANMNTVFLVTALNQDFNVRRLERYLVLAWESGAKPVVLLSKADLSDRIEQSVADVESVAVGVPIHVISSQDNKSLDALVPYIGEGQTVALLGSSGVGKSTLINRLVGVAVQETGDIRRGDGRGKHTTTHRELFALPGGGLLIDTPGMRELQLWDTEDGLGASFRDVEQLAERCRFPDCRHDREPGCAVQDALADGSLDRGRYQSYVKLQRELAYFARKENKALQLAEKEKWKKIHQSAKQRRNRL